MLTVRKILCPTDFSTCANQAVDQGILLAQELGAELHLLFAMVLRADHPVDPFSHFAAPEETYEKIKQSAEAEMATYLAGHPDAPFPIRKVVRRGLDPALAVLDYAEEEGVDLIVMGTHGRRGIRRFLLGSVAADVVRQSDRPVWTVPEREASWKPKPIQRIVAPVDFSEPSESSLRVAVDLARDRNAKVDLLHVILEAIWGNLQGYYTTGALLELRKHIEAESSRQLDKLGRELGIGVSWEAVTAVGHPARAIASHAEEAGADLIVMATQGRSGLDRLLLGSTTEKVLRLAGCSVLTIQADGKSMI